MEQVEVVVAHRRDRTDMTSLIILASIVCTAILTWVLGDIFDWWKRLDFWLRTRHHT